VRDEVDHQPLHHVVRQSVIPVVPNQGNSSHGVVLNGPQRLCQGWSFVVLLTKDVVGANGIYPFPLSLVEVMEVAPGIHEPPLEFLLNIMIECHQLRL
jgi:hypothetical protein